MNTLLIANTIISKMHSYNKIIRPMKLQKLLFYSLGFYHKEHKEDLLDDDFLHYQYGPVIPLVYHRFKKNKANPIEEPDVFLIFGEAGKWVVKNVNDKKARKIHSVLDKVINAYSIFTDLVLSEMTHELPSWKKTKPYEVIAKKAIFEDFKKREYGT